MPKSKGRKKKYVPKKKLLDNVKHVLDGAKSISSNTSLRILTLVYSALKCLKTGKGTQTDWETVAHALNMSELLATDLNIGKDYLTLILKGQQAHNNCGARANERGSFGYTGLEIQALDQTLEVHDQQLHLATISELERLADKIDKRVLSKQIDFYATKGVVQLEEV